MIRVRVAPHPNFQRKGNRLDVRVPITLLEAAEGAKIEVPTPKGTIMLTIPPGTSSGAKFRIRAAIRKIDAAHPLNPRSELRW
jgi:DnaJ-class molecular chaperone